MKVLKHLLLLFVVAVAVTSCTDEDDANGPSSFYTELSSDYEIGDTIIVDYSATQGDAELNTLVIREDGTNISASSGRLLIDGSAANANPILLFNEDRTSLDYRIAVVPDLRAGETTVITFEVTDAANVSSIQTLSVTIDTTGGGGGTDTPPVLTFTSFVEQSETIVQLVTAWQRGSSDLNTMTAYRNGVLMPAGELSFGEVFWSDNPYVLPSDLRSNDTTNLGLLITVLNTPGTQEYLFVLTDENGLSDSAEVEIVVPEDDLDAVVTDIALLNSAGPAGTGGVNLLNGMSTGSSDASAHLIDLGIDQMQPNATNWRRQIAPGLATDVLKSVADGFSFNDVTTKAAVEAAFNDASSSTISDAGSDAVEVGDNFVLRTTDGAFVLINVTNVINTTDNNSDQYVLQIKY